MKQLIKLILFISLPACGTAQIISVEKIKAVPRSNSYSAKDSSLIFPLFMLKNKKAEQIINQRLQDDFKKDMNIQKKEKNVRSMLVSASKEGLTDLDFEIVYQTKKIISFEFQWEWLAAYPSNWRTYYCFNAETGSLITLDSLIDREHTTGFLSLLKKKQLEKINLYKTELSAQFTKEEIDKETYDWH